MHSLPCSAHRGLEMELSVDALAAMPPINPTVALGTMQASSAWRTAFTATRALCLWPSCAQ